MKRLTVLLAVATTAALFAPSGASAHISPPGCTAGSPNIQFGGSSVVLIRDGDNLTLTASVGNAHNAALCDFDNATVTATFPNPDGTPGTPVVIATNQSWPAGTPHALVPGSAEQVVTLNPGIFDAEWGLNYSGTFHGTADDVTLGGGIAHPEGIIVSRPEATIVIEPNPAAALAPVSTTYTYRVTNTSAVDPERTNQIPAINPQVADRAIVADDTCDPLTYTGGDTNNDFLLQQGEEWTYTCSHDFPIPGSYVNTATIVDANSTRDGRAWPANTGQATVVAQEPDLTLAKSHTGTFVRGETGGVYSLNVTNVGTGPTSGTVSVIDTLPAGLTAAGISGNGWTCDRGTLTCRRSDTLGAGQSYPPVSLEVAVAADAPAQVNNTASVAGGSESNLDNNAASDPTAIDDPDSDPDPDPDNEFTVKLGKRHKDGGVTLKVEVPGAGQLSADDAAAKGTAAAKKRRNLVKRATKSAKKAGRVGLRLRPTKSLARKLERGAKKVRVKISFVPTGGTKASTTRRIKFKVPAG